MQNTAEHMKKLVASYSMKIVILATLFFAIREQQWLWVLGCIIGILISLIPTLLKKDYHITLPWSIELLIASVFALNMVGILLNAYYTIPGYTALTQLLISILIAFFAFAVIFILDEYWDGLKMDKNAMAFVVVITTMASAVILEFIKWFNIFGRKQTSVDGVLTCLFISTIGGIIMAAVGVNLIKKGTFDDITEELGKQIDSKIIKRTKVK